jgi:hypothetical protein
MEKISSLPTITTSKGTFFVKEYFELVEEEQDVHVNKVTQVVLYDENCDLVISLPSSGFNPEDPISVEELKSAIEEDDEI